MGVPMLRLKFRGPKSCRIMIARLNDSPAEPDLGSAAASRLCARRCLVLLSAPSWARTLLPNPLGTRPDRWLQKTGGLRAVSFTAWIFVRNCSHGLRSIHRLAGTYSPRRTLTSSLRRAIRATVRPPWSSSGSECGVTQGPRWKGSMPQASGAGRQGASPPSSYVEKSAGRDGNGPRCTLPAPAPGKDPCHARTPAPEKDQGTKTSGCRSPFRVRCGLSSAELPSFATPLHFESVTSAFMLSWSLRKCGGINS